VNTNSTENSKYINNRVISNNPYEDDMINTFMISDYVTDNMYYLTKNNIYLNNKSCCLVKKKFVNNNDCNSNFIYTYNKLYDTKCNPNLYKLDSNQQLLFNDDCNDTNIGSCRLMNNNKECIDFVNKNDCTNYNMIWSKKTCHELL
jgi:hypothetical protein